MQSQGDGGIPLAEIHDIEPLHQDLIDDDEFIRPGTAERQGVEDRHQGPGLGFRRRQVIEGDHPVAEVRDGGFQVHVPKLEGTGPADFIDKVA